MIIRPKLPPYQRLKNSNIAPKKIKMIAQTIIKDLPCGTELLESQVAGHTFQLGTDEIGKSNEFNFILKKQLERILFCSN